jgi:hypothetical protein
MYSREVYGGYGEYGMACLYVRSKITVVILVSSKLPTILYVLS